jgi:hypothetical protein
MYPHERSLVKKMEGKPFALVGVNSDQTREVAKQAATSEKLTWRSFYAGQGGGDIARTYEVRGWPTLFLIDHKGVIREKWVGSPGAERLDAAVEKLVKEVKDDLPRKGGDGDRGGSETKPPVEKPPPADPERLAASKLKFAQQLADDGSVDKAKQRCRDIIKQFPKTKAAKEAQELLDKLSQ